MSGVFLGKLVYLPWYAWLMIVLVLLAGAWLENRFGSQWRPIRRFRAVSPFPLFLLLAVAGLGATRYQQSLPRLSPASLTWYTQYEEVTLSGTVNAFPDIRTNAVQLRVKVDEVQLPESEQFQAVKGNVLVRLPWNPDWNAGDRIVLTGRLDLAPEGQNFDYRNYLARQKVFTYMAYPSVQNVQPAEKLSIITLIWRFRLAAEERLYRLLPWQEASLLDGILLGNERNIPVEMANAFRNTGTSHIIAISGFNIAIISALFVKLFSRLFPNRKMVFWVTVTAVTLYTLLVGAQPPVVRAAIMGTAGLLGSLIGRRQTGMNSLVFTAAVMAGITPAMLWDASFQLSFFATMGLVLLADPLSGWFERLVEKHTPRLQHSIFTKAVSEYILFTLAAQLATLPVLAFHFRQFPLVGLLANPLILPVQPLVMILGGLMLIFSLAWFPLGHVFAWLAYPPTAYTIAVVSWLSNLGGQPVALQAFSPLGLIAFYALILLLVYRIKLPPIWRKTVLPSTTLLLAFLLTISIWKPALTRLDDRLHIVIPEQGEGQAVLLLDGKGNSWLLAGGEESALAMQELTQWQVSPSSRLTGLIWAFSAIDRKSSSSIAYRLPGVILAPDGLLTTSNGADLFSRSLDWGADWQGFATPAHITLQNGAEVFISSACNGSCASLARYGSFELLAPAENDPAALAGWMNSLQASPEVILLPADGTAAEKWFSGPALPEILFISPGITQPVKERSLLGLEVSGWVDIATDGSQMWVSTQHPIED